MLTEFNKLDLSYMVNAYIDPDITFYNKFNGAFSSSKSFTGWQHSGSGLVSSMTLTQAAVHNAFSEFNDYYPGEIDQLTGIYKVGKGEGLYNELNEIQILPSVIWDIISRVDIQSLYDKSVIEFFQLNADKYTRLNRDAFLFHAIEMYKKAY